MKKYWGHRTSATAALACLALAAGCSGAPPDRAGGNVAAASVVLDMAVGNDEPPAQLAAWADTVKSLSKGTVTIRFVNGYAAGTTDYETRAFHDVVAGKIAAASFGARAMDRVGLTTFQALLAPMLVDSYDLEAKVFGSGVPEQMLEAIKVSGVVGVAILPGPMRKVLGFIKPFLQPTDFAGTRIADQDSALTEQAIGQLGATAVPQPSGARLVGVDGYEQQLSSIQGNGYVEAGAKYTTANLNLWPRPIVVMMGSEAYARLTQTERDALHSAAQATVATSIDRSRGEDTDALESLCRDGMQFPVASPGQLARLRTALQPVYAALAETDPTQSWITQIQQMKDELNAAPESVSCPAGTNTDSTPIDGTYEKRVTAAADIRRACAGDVPTPMPPENQVDLLTVTFDRGTVTQYDTTPGGGREIGWHGTYQVFRNTLQLTTNSDVLTMTWRLSGGTLSLTNLQNSHDCRDEAVWATHPWNKIPK